MKRIAAAHGFILRDESTAAKGNPLAALGEEGASKHMEKLLYLDFDGVLHPNHCTPAQWLSHLPALSDCLSGIRFEVKIVISSSWRFHYDTKELVARFPVQLRSKVVGTTGEAFIGKHSRYEEIQAHLNQYNRGMPWCALDDCAWEFPSPCPELILCDGSKGLDTAVLAELTRRLSQGF